MLRYRCDRPPASQRAPRSALPSARSATIAQEARRSIHLWFSPGQDNGQYAASFFNKSAYDLPDVFSRSFRLDCSPDGCRPLVCLGRVATGKSILGFGNEKQPGTPLHGSPSYSGGVRGQGKRGFRPLASRLSCAQALALPSLIPECQFHSIP